jgi:hypothetical protein
MEVLRKCRDCGKEAHNEAELEEFRKDKKAKYGRQNLCISCQAERERKIREENPDYRKSIRLKNKYGMTLNDYNIMFKEQKGCCKICGTHQSNLEEPLFVDHCHETEDVRGLLCRHCNTGLGMFKDNTTFLKNAIEYLKEK